MIFLLWKEPGKELFCVLFFTWTSKSLPVGDHSSQDRNSEICRNSKAAASRACIAPLPPLLFCLPCQQYSANRPRNVRRSTLCPVTLLSRFLLLVCTLQAYLAPLSFPPRGERYGPQPIKQERAHLVSASNRIALDLITHHT